MATRDGGEPAGWMVSLRTKNLGDETNWTRTYYVAPFFIPSEAEEAVKKRDGATLDELAEAVEPINQAALDGPGVAKGGTVRWR